MVTILKDTHNGEWIHDVRCLSRDTKPTEGIFNGSTLLEMDTGKMYMFDEDNTSWREI